MNRNPFMDLTNIHCEGKIFEFIHSMCSVGSLLKNNF